MHNRHYTKLPNALLYQTSKMNIHKQSLTATSKATSGLRLLTEVDFQNRNDHNRFN